MPAITVTGIPRYALRTGTSIHRIFRRFDADGRRRGPWFFSSAGAATAGRFDLAPPRGTCYFASTPVGAWLEVFRGTRLVDPIDVRRRHLATATRSGSPLRLGDLASPRAAAAGVTLDVAATSDYGPTQSLATALDQRGDDGVRALLRHDPSGASRNVALFGHAGAPSRQFGWRVARSEPWRDAALMRELSSIGIHVAEIPYEVPVDSPS